jgi:molybdenum cofactor biosynthesis protein B
MMRIVITPSSFSPDAELSRFTDSRGANAGAVSSFVGYCRASDGEVETLELQHYPGFTEIEVERLAQHVVKRHALDDVLVIHRVGAIEAGAPIVLVAAISGHRAAAFAAVAELMDYLKTDAPFWKREVGPGGARWIEPTTTDYARRQEHEKMTLAEHACRIDETLPFKPVRVAILTISDTRDHDSDTSGPVLAQRAERDGHIVAARAIVRDDAGAIQAHVKDWIADPAVDVVITTGGTGLTGRDITPEALRPLFDKEIEGFATVWHMLSYKSVGLSTLQSRACAGIARGKFIFALPGSNGACKDGWDNIIRWQLDSRHRPCNLVEIMPRLTER